MNRTRISTIAVAAFVLSAVSTPTVAQSPPPNLDLAPVWSSQDVRLYPTNYVADPFAAELWDYLEIAISKPWNSYEQDILVCKPQVIQQRYDAPGG